MGILEKKTNKSGGKILVTKPKEMAIGVTSMPPDFWIIGNVQSNAVAPVMPIAVERKCRIKSGTAKRLIISRDKSLKNAIPPCTGPQALVNTTLDKEYHPIPEANAKPCVIGMASTNAAIMPPHKEVTVNTMPV